MTKVRAVHTPKNFHEELKELMNTFVHKAYDCSQKFPREEIFGLTSQLRRASLSVVLNYIEGYARRRPATLKHFVEISYDSLKESAYLVDFAYTRKYIAEKDSEELLALSDRIGKMLWGILSKIER